MQTNIEPGKEVGKIVNPAGAEVSSKKQNVFELLIRDAETDLAIATTMRENITALRSWVGSIGNAKTRDVFKAFLDDSSQVLTSMSGQKKLILNHLNGMKAQWEKMNAAPATDSEPTAPETSSAEPSASSVPPAAAPEEPKA